MNIDFFVFPLIMVFSLFLGQKNTPKNRRTFIILVSLLLLLKASLRSLSVGSDTASYCRGFYSVIQMPWDEVLLGFIDRYSSLSGEYDYGYILLQKLIGIFFQDFHLFTFIAQLLFYIPFGILLYRSCSDFLQLTFAFVLYTALFMGLPMANARQFYSIGIGIMAFLCLYDKKYAKSAIWLFVGYLIHQTCLLVLIPMALSFIPVKTIKRIVPFFFLLFPIVLAFSNQIIYLMGSFVENERYMAYGLSKVQGGAFTFIVSTFFMCLFCFVSIKDHHLILNSQLRFFYVMLPLTVFFSPLIYSNGSMIRIVMYYQIYFVVLFPHAIDCSFSKDNRKRAYVAAILLLIFMSLRSSGLDYKFFWQESQAIYM